MKIDFLHNNCVEPSTQAPEFGLCDRENGEKAYSDFENPKDWIATVKNENKQTLFFTPIDKCLIHDNEAEGKARCDGMLHSSEHLYFIELKNKAKNWQQEAIEQLSSTIELFKENHDINKFRHKKVFACNKQHPNFAIIDNEENLAFFRKYKVRLDLQAEIIVV